MSTFLTVDVEEIGIRVTTTPADYRQYRCLRWVPYLTGSAPTLIVRQEALEIRASKAGWVEARIYFYQPGDEPPERSDNVAIESLSHIDQSHPRSKDPVKLPTLVLSGDHRVQAVLREGGGGHAERRHDIASFHVLPKETMVVAIFSGLFGAVIALLASVLGAALTVLLTNSTGG